jgi:hypothetical protein
MRCLHPNCPMGNGAPSWQEVVDHPSLRAGVVARAGLLANLRALGAPSSPSIRAVAPTINSSLLTRLLQLCPCLYNQVDIRSTPRAVVHLCEVTLGVLITSANVSEAFDIQHPRAGPPFAYEPSQACTDGGGVMESLCSEVLNNEGIPAMDFDQDGWPIWRMPGHVLLNRKKMRSVRPLATY